MKNSELLLYIVTLVVVFGALITFGIWYGTASCAELKQTLPYSQAQNRCLP